MNIETNGTGGLSPKKIEDILLPMQTLKISGRAAIDIVKNELDLMYDKMRQDDEEFKAQNVQIRILREEKEKQAAELQECKNKAETCEDDWESREEEFGELELRYVLVKGLCVGLSAALAAMWWFK